MSRSVRTVEYSEVIQFGTQSANDELGLKQRGAHNLRRDGMVSPNSDVAGSRASILY